MTDYSPVCFKNRDGLKLFGILHEPMGSNKKDIAILLLSPGIKMRVGPNLLYKTMANSFVAQGFPVLRFDFYGLGDSEGELMEEMLPDVYNHIEVGRYIDDTFDAMDWMEKEYGIRKFILSGLCGGAITGLLAASKDDRVIGLLGLGITPVLASSAANPSRYMTVGQLEDMRKTYIKKIFNIKAWFRFLTLQSDFTVLFKSLLIPLKRKLVNLKSVSNNSSAQEQDNSNPLFPSAFFSMLENRNKILLIFGGGDRLLWEFEEKFSARFQQKMKKYCGLYEIRVVEHANHVLSYKNWQQQMLDYSNQWLKTNYP